MFTQNRDVAKRVSAHRQTWFTSNALDFTPAKKMQVAQNIDARDLEIAARWKDDVGAQRSQLVVFDLINAENIRAREIAKAIDQNDAARATAYAQTHDRPLHLLNKLLLTSNIPITLSVEDDERVVASKNNGAPYSIAELSDGERNAMLLASQVLTAKHDTLFLIDEPERHLHRSIISPLLSALFRQRPDCAFVIATHDIGLPIDNPDSSVLVLRACTWTGQNVSGWDADFISATDEMDSAVKRDILGSRRTVLFVEGGQNSLDHQIYEILFPEVSVVPQGNCTDVERAVVGIRSTEALHWARAFGLIDGDNRQPDDLLKLKEQNIYALPCYSVESLYYSANMMRHIACRCANLTGADADGLVAKAQSAGTEAVKPQRERMCARACEDAIRASVKPPTWRDIAECGNYQVEIDIRAEMEQERETFDAYVRSNDVHRIIGRYPVRETPALKQIATALGFQSRVLYESTVIQALITDDSIRKETRESLGEVATALQTIDGDPVSTGASVEPDASDGPEIKQEQVS